MRKRILITGGPVHGYLDDVKIITNKFKGGMMAELARKMAVLGMDVTYLSSKDAKKPGPRAGERLPDEAGRIDCLSHDGIDSYREIVLDSAPKHDAVVLGAAVANLIPANPIKGKFPSHNYKSGDIIPINFTIAPRIIDAVKEVAPRTNLFGFKLLSGASHTELIEAAYDIVLESKACTVFANDAINLQQKFAVTKERGVHQMDAQDVARWIIDMTMDKYYRTATAKEFNCRFGLLHSGHMEPPEKVMHQFRQMLRKNGDRFVKVKDMIFGTIAIRFPGIDDNSFMTTQRGKNEIEKSTVVGYVNHAKRMVYVTPGTKATLNAPLLHRIFCRDDDSCSRVNTVMHFHEQRDDLETQPYAPPGTERDVDRDVSRSFNIKEHGCMLMLDKEGQIIK